MLNIKENSSNYLVAAICLAYTGLFLDITISNITIILLLVLCLVVIRPKDFIPTFKSNPAALLLILFYLLHVVGVLYSENKDNAIFVLEKKASLFLFPLILLPALATLSQSKKENLLFLLGLITAASGIVFVVIGFIKKYIFHYDLAFHKDHFPSIHYVFYSLYFAVGSLILLYYTNQFLQNSKNRTPIILLIILYSIGMLVLISSKTGIFAYVSGLIYFLYLKVASRKVFYGASIGVVCCVAVFLMLYPATLNRFTELSRNIEVLGKDELKDYEEFTGLNLRLYFWKTSVSQLWNDQSLVAGIGTGDGQDYLNNAYRGRHLDQYGYTGYDAHNQWIMTLLQLGMIGVSLLASILFFGLRRSIKDRNYIWQFFAWIVLCFTLTESMLEANKGVVFFALFFCLLVEPAKKEGV